jgi:AcrR family transcriptional regulator
MSGVPTARLPIVPGDTRRRQLLEAALTVFARHGYRKTSMDEIAQAADVSRQGLYLHFPTKEDLFREMVLQVMQRCETAVSTALAAPGVLLEDRLVSAFDESVGRFVEAKGSDVDDMINACHVLLGPLLEEHRSLFADHIADVVESSGLAAYYATRGLTARQLADTLCATAEGLKSRCRSRAEFVGGIRVAVHALCLPLEAGR